MREHQHEELTYFAFESFPATPGKHGNPLQAAGLRHAIFSRRGGHSQGPFASLNMSMSVPDERDHVYANRRKVYGLFGRDTHTVVHAHLVHGADVARVTRDNDGQWVEHVDAIITDQPGCVLSMNFADCGPILIYDPVHRAAGLGHAGWRGAMVDLPGAMVRAMSEQFGSNPADLIAAIGPSIGPCCYEVGEEVLAAASQAFDDHHQLFHRPTPDSPRPHLDLSEANRRALARAGVSSIELSGFCTACRTDLFFSHRAERGRTGRFGAVMAIPGRD